MGTCYYYVFDERVGPVDGKELLRLKKLGVINPDTIIEKDGKKFEALNIRGLFLPSAEENTPPIVERAERVERAEKTDKASKKTWTNPSPDTMTTKNYSTKKHLQARLYAQELYAVAEEMESLGTSSEKHGTFLIASEIFIGICTVASFFVGIFVVWYYLLGIPCGVLMLWQLSKQRVRQQADGMKMVLFARFAKLTAMQYLAQEDES